jgi:hypothetical protein
MEPWFCLAPFLVLAVVSIAVLGVKIVHRSRQLNIDGDRAMLYASGQAAEATVVWVVYGNEAFRGDPVVNVMVRLAPVDGSEPVTVSRDFFVSALTVPWFGGPVAACYDQTNPSRFVLVTRIDADTPAHLRELHERLRALPQTPAPHRCEIVTVLARLGQLSEDLGAGRLTREAHFQQHNDLYNAAFP